MSEPSDGDGSGKPEPDDTSGPEAKSEGKGKPARAVSVSDEVAREVPGHVSKMEAGNDEPPVRPSAADLLGGGKLAYPDDGPFSSKLRKFDSGVGTFEQGVLVFLMAALVLVTAAMAIADKAAEYRPHWKDDLIRSCTFGIAMFGGAFASHQAKHLAMDLISRRLAPRKRLFLRVFLGLFTCFIVYLFIRAGLQNAENEGNMAAEDKLISNARLAWFIPIGGGLMLLHTLVHAIIDVDYIVRHKTPPERMRSGH